MLGHPTKARLEFTICYERRLMEFSQVGELSITTNASYAAVVDRVKSAISEKGWKVISVNASSGVLQGKGRFYLNSFDISVTFRTVATNMIQVDFECYFPNDLNIWESGKARSKELIEAVVQGNWTVPDMPPPAFTLATAPVNATSPDVHTNGAAPLPQATVIAAPSAAPLTTSWIGGRLIWVMGGGAALAAVVGLLMFAGGDESQCKKEAYNDFVTANRIGGAAEYIKLCVKMKRMEREIEATRRKP